MPPQQLSLGIGLSDDARLDNFYARPDSANQFALTAAQRLLSGDEQYVCLWGGKGRSHLAQALCLEASARGWQVQYLPLATVRDYAFDAEGIEAALSGLEYLDLICLDDLDQVLGHKDWERGLFHLFNRLRDAGVPLLVCVRENPAHLQVGLADLKSRLQWGLSCQLQPLNDDEKLELLQMRAQARGLQLTPEVAQYLIQRVARDLDGLFRLLDELDRASLQQQRKLTIPFVRQVLETDARS